MQILIFAIAIIISFTLGWIFADRQAWQEYVKIRDAYIESIQAYKKLIDKLKKDNYL